MTGPDRRQFLTTTGLVGAGVVGAGALGAVGVARPSAAAASTPSERPRGGFVQVRGRQFALDGKPFRFGGTNTYYLHQQSQYMIDAALDDAAAMSLRVVRAWAFADGSGQSFTALQPEPYVYDEDAFEPLDYAVYKAGRLGLKLVLTLVNNWPDYGGMQQYVKWFTGLPDDSYAEAVNHDRFYTDARIRRCYRAYVRHVITRRNRYTGLRYNEDPTVMTFELANEPRSRSDRTGQALLSWVQEMSAWIAYLAPRQMVAVGDEGFLGQAGNTDYPYSDYEGYRWAQLSGVRSVDYATTHLYPQNWGATAAADPVTWGTKWIADHVAGAARLRKPLVLEEYGLQIDAAKNVPDVAARDAGYRAWTQACVDGGAQDQFWLLTSRIDDGSFYPDYDGYRIVWNADASNPSRTTAALLSAHAKSVQTG